MSAIEVVPATLAHARDLAPRMREADRAELWATDYLSPLEGLTSSLSASPLAWAGLVDGVPVCLFGVGAASMLSGWGRPWLLGTDALEQHQRAFLRRNRAYVAQMQAMFPYLGNHVDARNRTSIRWLRWLGFTIHGVEPYGPMGLPFHPFTKEATC